MFFIQFFFEKEFESFRRSQESNIYVLHS